MYSKEWTRKTVETIKFFDEAFKELEEIVIVSELTEIGDRALVNTVRRLLAEREKLDE